jgi:septal ring factor EnvC (AmiA/AmiB activator)
MLHGRMQVQRAGPIVSWVCRVALVCCCVLILVGSHDVVVSRDTDDCCAAAKQQATHAASEQKNCKIQVAHLQKELKALAKRLKSENDESKDLSDELKALQDQIRQLQGSIECSEYNEHDEHELLKSIEQQSQILGELQEVRPPTSLSRSLSLSLSRHWY